MAGSIMLISREVRRVPLDFDWPLNKVWQGYVTDEFDWPFCPACEDGDGLFT